MVVFLICLFFFDDKIIFLNFNKILVNRLLVFVSGEKLNRFCSWLVFVFNFFNFNLKRGEKNYNFLWYWDSKIEIKENMWFKFILVYLCYLGF